MAHAMLRAGWDPATFEYRMDQINENCLTVEGQTAYVLLLPRCAPRALNVMGPPCKFWLPFLTSS
eukprot:14858508-Alexandrium_andersonii.AAC.1